MSKYAHVVIIHCSDRLSKLAADYADIARAFTREEDADAFIEDCKHQDGLYPNGKYYTYETKRIELDGNPLDGY